MSARNELLDTLIERWEEVAEAYKPGDLPWDDTTRKYRDYRQIYLRNIRDLRHVLDSGQIPCSLMNDEERRRGDCGQVHDEDDHVPQLAKTADRDPWTADPTLAALVAFRRVVACHLAEMFLDGPTGDVHEWARGIAREAKRAGVDIDDDIVARLRTLTVGSPTADNHPF